MQTALRSAARGLVRPGAPRAVAASPAAMRALASEAETIKKTPLYDFHVEKGAKMVPFAGWSMPVQYADLPIGASHVHTRTAASVFDVSHMLQFELHGNDRERFLEGLTVADLSSLDDNGSAALTVFTNENGGIIDDLIVTRFHDHLYLVANAGCADKDLAHIAPLMNKFTAAGGDVRLVVRDGTHALLALQGPKAADVLSTLVDDDLSKQNFMQAKTLTLKLSTGPVECLVTRCGYTGEDGFEISVPAGESVNLARALLECSPESDVRMAGLGARDSLRLEAGLNLYGHEMNEDILPAEAGLAWTISPRRRREGGFLGASRVLAQVAIDGASPVEPPARVRVGFSTAAPARGPHDIVDPASGEVVGTITSGGPCPSLGNQFRSLGFIKRSLSKVDTEVVVKARRDIKATVVKTPFVPHKYYRGAN
ncbi:glycine cleavage system T protein [Fonticula alba]|uniref:Aminomethyltransferase n=1 Tax=Fonticula alba TaxID=691883 RepID=A0A058ZEV3_FONAL|nr:glycine cleavage system T protein [Fonticula alba]KCV72909.1 glycine cleavage system T protein [Fonticula alba]|eukprot:XP_009492610.1 glycine cleavage system T protein [Fonticula alba]